MEKLNSKEATTLGLVNARTIPSQPRPDARKNGDPFELAYYHYSVYMNKRRRTAWFSAANVDGDHRPQIGKRQGDRWYQDTRILISTKRHAAAVFSGWPRLRNE